SGDRAGERGSVPLPSSQSTPDRLNSDADGGNSLLSPALSSRGGEGEAARGGSATSKVKVRISTGVQQIRKSDNNVVAGLPATGDPARAEYVLVGAHYDHLGRGEGGSLERAGE